MHKFLNSTSLLHICMRNLFMHVYLRDELHLALKYICVYMVPNKHITAIHGSGCWSGVCMHASVRLTFNTTSAIRRMIPLHFTPLHYGNKTSTTQLCMITHQTLIYRTVAAVMYISMVISQDHSCGCYIMATNTNGNCGKKEYVYMTMKLLS